MVNRGAVRGSVVDCSPTCTKAQTWLLSSCNSSTWKVEDCQKFKASPVHTESSRAAEPEPELTVTSCPDHPRCFANLCLDIGGGACFQDTFFSRSPEREGRKCRAQLGTCFDSGLSFSLHRLQRRVTRTFAPSCYNTAQP